VPRLWHLWNLLCIWELRFSFRAGRGMDVIMLCQLLMAAPREYVSLFIQARADILPRLRRGATMRGTARAVHEGGKV